ncbi:PREDICTED: serine/threonine-protein phosphatase 6 regulatory subunit 1 [Condylura cristata]|uniref:serine/threonine-protein phosphatase 6 regulatory subunit 1 n=1 Tax=Condylura cristata TaxID=143302 RepID=UPI000643AE88|nr:PREDICTED: serine/threonine-protein phosphatase 6 regulatory subunit 1 [Condylura cristata]
MFWKFDLHTSSHLDTLLEREDLSLPELLDEEDVLQECKVVNRKLLDFLLQPPHLQAMVAWVTQEPPASGEERLRYKQETIEQLLSNMLEGEQSQSVIVSGVQVLLTLLEPRRPRSESVTVNNFFSSVDGQLELMAQAPLDSTASSPGTLHALRPRLSCFHQLLLKPPEVNTRHLHSSSDDEDERLKEFSFPEEAVLQQAFMDFQMQRMTSAFIDHFGFNDEEFGEQEESVNAPFDKTANITFSLNADDDNVTAWPGGVASLLRAPPGSAPSGPRARRRPLPHVLPGPGGSRETGHPRTEGDRACV